jgi:tetracenomycin polyketide synthesis O-methyltransferase tcmP
MKFNGVEETLFIPLAARVLISKNYSNYFLDTKSLELGNLEQVKSINKKTNEYLTFASVARYYVFDKIINNFINKNKDVNIVSLGVGLETMNYRIKDNNNKFYSIDFDKVIDLRLKILGKKENETLIKSDILDMKWTEKVDKNKATLFVVAGVFQYLKEEKILKLITNLKEKFKDSEMIFDATNSLGIKRAINYVKKTGNKNAMMYFYVNNEEKFANLANVKLLEVYNFFKKTRKVLRKELKISTRISMLVADKMNMTKILHIKL